MGTPKGGYYIDGEKVPSVTTVIGRFKESGALIYWAWKEGKEGRTLDEARTKAADAGTAAHEMVQCWKTGETFDRTKYPEPVINLAKNAFTAFLEWSKQTKLQISSTEVGLVSKVHRFGGTMDAVIVQDKLSLADWKTSKGVYMDMILQLAAYGLLWEENYPERPLLGGYHLCRFSKAEDPDSPVSFSHHFWSDLDVARKQFILLRQAYELDKKVKDLL